MKLNFTYKEYSLILGILVALIIFFTVWMNQKPKEQSSGIPSPKRESSVTTIVQNIARNATASIRF